MDTSQGPAHSAPALIGRDREQATLRDHLAAARAGHGGLVLIGGEAGVGKTALAEWLCAEAADQGALVLVGRCYDLAETPPYGPWAEALACGPRDDELPALPAAVLPPEHEGKALTSQGAIARRTLAYLVALGKTPPLVLLLEDLHWADAASLDLLRALARSLAGVPVLLLATYRPDEVIPDHPLHALLPAVVREARAARLDLRPLDPVAIGALIAVRYALGTADRDRLTAYLTRRTEGNALFVVEVLRTLETSAVLRETGAGWTLGELAGVPVPTLLRQVIAGRLARLGDEDRRLLGVAAVLGQEPPFDLWAAVGEVEEGVLLATAERAVAARALEATVSGVRFAHALIREALYTGVLAPRRRGWHRRAGEALLATPHPDPDAVAYHLRQAGDVRAAAWLVRAGERAERAYAWLTAADRYEAALALLETGGGDGGRRGWLAFRLAALRRNADGRQALGHAEEAARLAGEAGDPLLAAMATYLAGMLLGGYLRELQRGISRMEAALAALTALPGAARVPPGADAPLDPAPRRGTVVLHLAWSGRHAEALALGARYLAEVAPLAAADWLGGNPHADAHGGLAHAYMMLGQPARARAAYAHARDLNRAVGHHLQAAGAMGRDLEMAAHYRADHPVELRGLLDALVTEGERTKGLYDGEHAQFWLLLPQSGDGAAARHAAARVTGTWRPATLTHGVLSAAVGALYRAHGDGARAGALVAQALPHGPDTPPGNGFFGAATALQRLAAALALDAGDLPLALAWLDAHDRWLDWGGSVLGRAEGALGRAAYHRAAGDHAQARQHAEHALAHATAPRQPLALLAAHRLLGELDTAGDRRAEAVAHLDAALALADACAAPYERALTLLAQAELRAAGGDHGQVTAQLAEARALLEPLEARPALARAEALAARLAATVPAPAYPAGLSAREVEVLRLVAAGRANHEIAAQLSISPNTVLRHVSTILAKTGTANRAAAAVFALRHGLDAPDTTRP